MAVPSTHSGRRQSATGGRKGERANTRNRYPCGYRPRWLDTQMGTIYLIAPKKATYRSLSPHVSGVDAALIHVVQEAFIPGISMRKVEKLARSLRIENLSRNQIKQMTRA